MHSEHVEDSSPAPPPGNQKPASRVAAWPRKRLGLLGATVIAYVAYFNAEVVFINGPTPVRALIVSGVLFCLVAIAIALLVAVRSRRWAIVVAVVSIGWITTFTTMLVSFYRPL